MGDKEKAPKNFFFSYFQPKKVPEPSYKENRLPAVLISNLKKPSGLGDKEKAPKDFFFSYFQPKKVHRTLI